MLTVQVIQSQEEYFTWLDSDCGLGGSVCAQLLKRRVSDALGIKHREYEGQVLISFTHICDQRELIFADSNNFT